jgi:hypothetical protein
MANAARHDTNARRTDSDKPVRTFATIVGATFLLVGILGFVPGITQDFDTIQFAGHESNAKLLGIFQVSVLHNLVHLAFGVAGLALARKASTAVNYLIVGGVVYLVLFVYGIATDHSSEGNFVPVNAADDYLHLVLGIAMIALGLIGRKIWRDGDTHRTV